MKIYKSIKKNMGKPSKKTTLKCLQIQKKNNKGIPLFAKMVALIAKPKKQIHFIIALLAVVFGFVFNAIDKMPLFWLKGIFGFALYIILSFAIKYITEKNKELEMELTGDPFLSKCQLLYQKKINSNYNFILCVLAGIYFVNISIILDFVQFNAIGVYSLIALAFVVFCAFIIFQYYIYLLTLMYNLSKIKPNNYFELIPERTKWFDLLVTFSNTSRNIFISLGTIFILLFILFSPLNSIQIIFQEGMTSPKFLPLLITWIIILIAIIFMVPFTSLVRSTLLKKIYKNMTAQSITIYNNLFKTSDDNLKSVYMNIIFRLNDSKLTLKNSFSWIFPLIVTITNYVLLIISIISDLKSFDLFT